MSRLESASKIEGVVGAKRHQSDHLARAISAEQRVYILHSKDCLARGIDLRECEFSIALDIGIDTGIWDEFQDHPVVVTIDPEYEDLSPSDPVRAVTDEQEDKK